jgi:leader peptidase (prepilin peptidase)/N-methyltransferase
VIVTGDADRLVVAVLTSAVTGSALLLVALALPGQLGLGDVNFASALALSLGWLHWDAAPMGLFAAFGIQAAFVLGLRVTRRQVRGWREGIPLGPALFVGWLLMAWGSSVSG